VLNLGIFTSFSAPMPDASGIRYFFVILIMDTF